mmetsp:Transcript_28628/g.70867  ORF Transcript_28628/g.70867 Transcript_28628/m.70867 type:complete len:259 (+) Transcript_28628:713-1489(+)
MATVPSALPVPRSSPSGWKDETLYPASPGLPLTTCLHLPVAMSWKAQVPSAAAETMYSPVACSVSPATSPVWFFHVWTPLPLLALHTRTVLSAEALKARSCVGCNTVRSTFLLCPSILATAFPLLMSKSTTLPSPPPVSTRSLFEWWASRQVTGLERCTGKEPFSVKAFTSSSDDSPGGASLFLRAFDSSVLFSVIRALTASEMPTSPAESSSMASPRAAAGAGARAPGVTAARSSAARASSLSFISLATTRQAASCW